MFVLVLLFIATSSNPAVAQGPHDGWSIVEPATVGINAPRLSFAKDYAFDPQQHTQGLVIVRNGHIASEWYAPGKSARSWAASWSMAKSVTSILVGIAIDKHLIASVDLPMTTWFPEWRNTDKADITLRDVLTMTSGLSTFESFVPANAKKSTAIQLGLHADELQFAASRPVEHAPDTLFSYSSADVMLLSRVLAVATKMPVNVFAKKYLFDPLGIRQVAWWSDAKGNTLTYCCIDSTTRNFARIGLLYLNHGNWRGRQIVSSHWVNASLTPSRASHGIYGMQWWIMHYEGVPGPVYEMQGRNGQFVYLLPRLQLVIARNGTYEKSSCPPVADPNLFGRYPLDGAVSGAGTQGPANWNSGRFLRFVVKSVKEPSAPKVYPLAQTKLANQSPDGRALRPCPDTDSLRSQLARAPIADPRHLTPTYTG